MNAKDAIRTALQSTQHLLQWYLSDLSDADLLVRPAPGANHIAWQLGHLIGAEAYLVGKQLPPGTYPELPNGFSEQYTKTTAASDSPSAFHSKEEYLGLFNKMRETSVAALAKMPDADLDKPTTGDMAKFAPTLGSLFILQANHTMMHVGQFTVVRRKLGKPILF